MEIKAKIMTVLTVILGIVVLFLVIGNLAPTIAESGDSITDANNCSEYDDANGNALEYNITDKYCYSGNATGNKIGLAGQYDLPLNSLFGRSGVILTIVMISLFIGIITLALKRRKT